MVEMAVASDFTKLLLVLWKNVILLSRKKMKMLLLLVWPAMIIYGLMYLRANQKYELVPNQEYPPLAIDAVP